MLALIAQGLSYKEVGERVYLSPRTVKYHMAEIMRKLHLQNRAQVLAYAGRLLTECDARRPADEQPHERGRRTLGPPPPLFPPPECPRQTMCTLMSVRAVIQRSAVSAGIFLPDWALISLIVASTMFRAVLTLPLSRAALAFLSFCTSGVAGRSAARPRDLVGDGEPRSPRRSGRRRRRRTASSSP